MICASQHVVLSNMSMVLRVLVQKVILRSETRFDVSVFNIFYRVLDGDILSLVIILN